MQPLRPTSHHHGAAASSSSSSSCSSRARRGAAASTSGRAVAAPRRRVVAARAGTWLENRAEAEVAVPLELAWAMWEDRARIPTWMPWIRRVEVLPDDPALSRWTLATTQFGRDWEFSWLARNLTPVRGQKIHWVSEPGSSSGGSILDVNNNGQVRFARRGPEAVGVSLTISYEVPGALAPFASALTPLVEGIIGRDMERFREYAEREYAAALAARARKQQQGQQQQAKAP